MATFEVMKKSLETMEKNVKISKKLLEDRVNSLDEMKRNRQEAETEGERRELKIAIEALEEIIGKDRTALADMEVACKDLREEFDKAEAEKEAQDDEDHISDEDHVSETEEKETFTREELEAEIAKRGVASLSFKFEKLCQALSEGEEEKRRKGGRESEEDRFFRGPPSAPERKRILGTLPSFVTGTTDFQLHLEAFRDFCELNDLTDNPLKVKRLFLTSLDQTARLRCAGRRVFGSSERNVCSKGQPSNHSAGLSREKTEGRRDTCRLCDVKMELVQERMDKPSSPL